MEQQQVPFDESSSAGHEEGSRSNSYSTIEDGQKLSPQERFMTPPIITQSSRALPGGGRGLALAGLILAVAALVVLLLTPWVGLPALVATLICSLAGLLLSALGYRSPSARPIARVGLVLSLVEIVLVLLFLLLVTPVNVQRQY